MRHHTQYRRSLFIPRDNCPIPQEDISNYRKTIVRYADKPDGQHIEEACLEKPERQATKANATKKHLER